MTKVRNTKTVYRKSIDEKLITNLKAEKRLENPGKGNRPGKTATQNSEIEPEIRKTKRLARMLATFTLKVIENA